MSRRKIVTLTSQIKTNWEHHLEQLLPLSRMLYTQDRTIKDLKSEVESQLEVIQSNKQTHDREIAQWQARYNKLHMDQQVLKKSQAMLEEQFKDL